MKRIVTTSLTLAALAFGGTAIATTPAKLTMASCDTLIQQFDKVVGDHGTAPKLQNAKDMRAAGEKACKAGNYKKGVADLETALNDIGVKPEVK